MIYSFYLFVLHRISIGLLYHVIHIGDQEQFLHQIVSPLVYISLSLFVIHGTGTPFHLQICSSKKSNRAHNSNVIYLLELFITHEFVLLIMLERSINSFFQTNCRLLNLTSIYGFIENMRYYGIIGY